LKKQKTSQKTPWRKKQGKKKHKKDQENFFNIHTIKKPRYQENGISLFYPFIPYGVGIPMMESPKRFHSIYEIFVRFLNLILLL
jgi:hypothetical protein